MAGPFGAEPVAVVIAAPTAEAFLRLLAGAERAARIAELRLDSLPSVAEVVRVLERLARRRPRLTLIATCRPSQGHAFTSSAAARVALLRLAAQAGCAWVDVEAETLKNFPPALRQAILRLPRGVRRIVSCHDFQRTPARLDTIYRRAACLGGDLVKLAVTARCQRDNLAVLQLARQHRRCVIALAMGTAGIPSRLLGLRAGSALTYAALDPGSTAAPGLLPLSHLRHFYRVHRLDARTRVYGVIGQPVIHSLSPLMQNAAFRAAGLNAVYLPFEVRALGDFLACIHPLGIAGFSVTLPHKQTILRYLDAYDPLARRIGAVNTVVVQDSQRLYGFNTDYVGVLRTLARYMPLEAARVLLLGAGGAARAVAFALATAGAFVTISSRRLAQARKLAQAVDGEAIARRQVRRRQFDAIVNCTPLGMYPHAAVSPLSLSELNARVVFDLVYTPRWTCLLRLARQRGALAVPGWQVLLEQGAAQFEIWTGLPAPVPVMRRTLLRALTMTTPQR